MSLAKPIRVEGLAEWQSALGRFSQTAGDQVDRMMAMVADDIADEARPMIPRGPTGAARASLGTRDGLITGGGGRVPYFGWLVFGGRVGRRESIRRDFVAGGRWIWPTWAKRRTDILTAMEQQMAEAARGAGLGG